MADAVQRVIETMVADLLLMKEKRLASKDETKAILNRRKDFEYRLRSRHASQTDFLDYIDYEQLLLRLIRCRQTKAGRKSKKASRVEIISIRQIHFLYQRATRRRPDDLSMWIRWLEFTKSTGVHRTISKIIAKALQHHARHAGLWIFAANYELSTNQHPQAARVLLQRGLRLLPNDHSMWQHLFRTEIAYMLRVVQRRQVLGLDDVQSAAPSLPSLDVPQLAEEKSGKGPEPVTAIDNICSGAVVRAVFKNAANAVHDADFWMSFLPLCSMLPTGVWEQTQEYILDRIDSSFPTHPGAVIARARLAMAKAAGGAAKEKAATAVIAKAVEATDDEETKSALFDAAVSFWAEFTQHDDWETSYSAAQRLLDTCRAAEEAVALPSAAVRIMHIQCLNRSGETDNARELAETVTQERPDCEEAWVMRAQMLAAAAAVQNKSNPAQNHAVLAILAQACTNCPNSLTLLRMRAEMAITCHTPLEQIDQMFSRQLQIVTDAEIARQVRSMWLQHSFVAGGPEHSRTILRKMLQVPMSDDSTSRVIMHAVKLEQCSGSDFSMARLRPLLNQAATGSGKTNTALWLLWLKLEREHGDPAAANHIQWRASNELEDKAAFFAKLTSET